MNKQRTFSRTLLAIALTAFGASGAALALDEIELNNPIQSAQRLTLDATGNVSVKGVIGNMTGSPVLDADFYSFEGQEGDVMMFDIDGGWGGMRKVDTVLTLFSPEPTYQWLYEKDDAMPLDEGSASSLDARIDEYPLPATGRYTVAVTPSGVFFTTGPGATYRSTLARTNGDYTLTIKRVKRRLLHVNIEIKPGSGEFAPANPKAKGTVPVALISSKEFNALEVEVSPKTLKFGRTGEEFSLRRCGKEGEDVNGDGRLDLVCHFENQLAEFTAEDDEGIVKGKTKAGQSFEGRGMLKVVPVKREEY